LTGKLQTAQAVIGDLPEKDKKSNESVKQEMLPELTNGANKVCKEEGSGEGSSRETISSGSASSEILNVDSPRTMDSGAPTPLVVVPINLYPEIDSNAIIHFQSDNLCDQMLPPLDCSRLISVKPEDGSFQDDSCNYILSQLEDEKGLPWWEWP
jgi:homeobox-leucine zipper protein